MNKKIFLSITLACTIGLIGNAQNNVGIGTNTPDASAVLDITSTNTGLLIPRVTLTITTSAAPVTTPATSLLVYNTATVNDVTPGYYYWDGTAWVTMGGSGSGGGTLDAAYDFGGPGAGRIVDVADGSVEFNQTSGTNTEVLTVTTDQGTSVSPTAAIFANTTGVGNAIYAQTNNVSPGNEFPAIAGISNNSTGNDQAVLGLYIGSGAFGTGVWGQTNSTGGGLGLAGLGTGTADGTFGTYGFTNGGTANAYGMLGVYGDGTGAINIWTSGTITSAGVYGVNEITTGGAGVLGEGVQGVVGLTDFAGGFGTAGVNFGGTGPAGQMVGVFGNGGYGVWGQSAYTGGIGIYGLASPSSPAPANYSQGASVGAANVANGGTLGDAVGVAGEAAFPDWAVMAVGDLGSTGFKNFVIDHPLDPENKVLKHFCMESDEVLNVYRGTIEINNNGEAVVELPHYFNALNIDFSYHLTPVGQYAELYIKEEIKENSFVIAGGKPGMKVSWSVYSQRNDEYAKQNPMALQTELKKTEKNKGKYLMPQLYGESKDKAIIGGELKSISGKSGEHKPSTKKPLPQAKIKLHNKGTQEDKAGK